MALFGGIGKNCICFSFSRAVDGTKPTITRRSDGVAVPGNTRMSAKDFEKLNQVYECDKK